MRNNENHGMWGGLMAIERKKLRRQRKKAVLEFVKINDKVWEVK
jgi:hypothetical protein